MQKIFKEWKDPQHWENTGKVVTDCIADINTKSDDNFSNTSSDNLASVKAALLLTLAKGTNKTTSIFYFEEEVYGGGLIEASRWRLDKK